MFIDEAKIEVAGGDGGNGCMSFRREKFVPHGGPDGGDGGKGGSVFLVADNSVDTLLDFAGRHHWRAKPGRHGQGKNMTGRSGDGCELKVPPGTLVYDRATDLLLRDLVKAGEKVEVARGGRGGRGNARFTTSTRQAPRISEEGNPGQTRSLRLELKLIADAGLIGKPNAGKSTLLTRVSSARPKIAGYPFTTLEPVLGIVEMAGYRRLVIADIPGLIEGAHRGLGLGDTFLRHIERTRILLHLIEAVPFDGSDPLENYHAIREELEAYSPHLTEKTEVIVATKLDLTGAEDALKRLRRELASPIHPISAVTGQGLDSLMQTAWDNVKQFVD